MELLDVITLFGVLGVISTIVMVLIFRVVPRKSPKKQVELDFIRISKANSELMDEITARKDAMVKSIASENNRLKKMMDDSPEEEEELAFPPELLIPIAKKLNMKPEMVQTLLASPQVKKLLKGNKDLLPLILPLLGGGNGNANSPTQEVFSQNSQSNQY